MANIEWDQYGIRNKKYTVDDLQRELDKLLEVQHRNYDPKAPFQTSSYIRRQTKINTLLKELS